MHNRIFEIHITGKDSGIIPVAADMGLKTISIDLLRPNWEVIRTSHMTAIEAHFPTFLECVNYATNIINELWIRDVGTTRMKIECPYYPDYAQRALYIESHFPHKGVNVPYPISALAGKRLDTDRDYDGQPFLDFAKKYADEDVELCLCDSNPTEDADWYSLWGWRSPTLRPRFDSSFKGAMRGFEAS